MQQDLTKGSITGQLLGMAAFIGIGLVFQTLYFLIDLYFVSRLGSESIAGVSSAGSVFFLALGATQLVAVGTMALIAQAIGAKREGEADVLANQSLSLSLVMGGLAYALILALGGAGVSQVAADAPTAAAGREYLFAFAPNLGLMFPTGALGSSLRAAGVVRGPMLVQSATLVLNAVLAPVLIAGWGTGVALGVAGAGWASSIAAAVGFVALLAMFPRVQTLMRFAPRKLAPQPTLWGRIVGVGLPASVEFLLMFIVAAVVYWVIRHFGAEAQAGFGVGARILQSILLPAMAVAFAAAPIAGQNFGAGQTQRVVATFQQAALISIAIMLLMVVLVHWRPDLLLRPFTDDPAALTVARDYLQIASWNFVASGVIFTCSSMFQGLGDTRPSLIASASRLLTFAAPALWLSGQPFVTLSMVWWLSVASVLVQMLISLVLLRAVFRAKLGRGRSPRLTPDPAG